MRFALSFAACLLASVPALAAENVAADAAAAGGAPRSGTTLHDGESMAIIVTAPYSRDRATALSSVSVLQGIELTRELRATVADTLAHQPGVSTTSFGPNASRPILRGFQGERVRVLTDGIGSFDVSNTSVDHAVAINPQLADRIEVLRGPASLLYGSSAIGGVVNVLDKRIPREVPTEPLHVDILGTYGSVSNERSGAGVVELPIGDRLVLHADASYNRSDDLKIGGFVLSRPARAAALASEEPAANDLAGLAGRLPNSAGRTWNVGFGAAFIDTGGELGIAVSRYDSLYGIPPRFDLATGEGEPVQLAIRQDRIDARGALNGDGGFVDQIKFRFGFADYRHFELEPDGAIGTTFFNKGLEGRIELVQSTIDLGGVSWRGASGLQIVGREFDVIGEEAFLPRSQSTQVGVFTFQEFDFGRVKAEVAGRYEHADVTSRLEDFRGSPVDVARRFDLFSGSVGASVALFDGWRIGLNLSHTERAPAAEELLANGPHVGTQAFEIGNPDFAKERSNGAELVLRGSGDRYSFEAALYVSRFSNFIYEEATGAVEDGLPVFQQRQAGARYFGFEIQGAVTAVQIGDTAIKVDALLDYTEAKLLGGLGPVPRIPPLRVLGGVSATGTRWDARAEIEHAFRQGRVANFETPTDAYTLVNLSASLRPFANRPNTALVVSVNNLFDVDARRHASFLKDFAPLPGRDFRISLRFAI